MHIRTPSRLGKALALATTLFCAGMFTGCGGFFQAITTTTTTNTGTGFDLVYAGKNSADSFVGYAITSNGLTAVSGSPFSIGSPPLSMAINPADSFLYVGTIAGIYGYSIPAGGSLSVLNSGATVANTPSVLSNGPVSMDISPDGNWLAVLTSFAGGSVTVLDYQITSATGLLTFTDSVSLAQVNSGSIAHSIKFSPSENLLAVTLGTDGTDVFTFTGANGTISSTFDHLTPPVVGNSDNGAVFNAASSTLYITRAQGSLAGVLAYYPVTYNSSNNTVTLSTGTEIATGDFPTALSFNNATTQPYLYAVTADDSSISGYAVTTSTPSLQTLSTQPYSTLGAGNAPYALAFDNSDTYMLVLNQNGPPDLIQYTVDATPATAGRLYVTGSVTTGLGTLSTTTGAGITMVTTH